MCFTVSETRQFFSALAVNFVSVFQLAAMHDNEPSDIDHAFPMECSPGQVTIRETESTDSFSVVSSHTLLLL